MGASLDARRVAGLAAACEFEVVERCDLPGRAPRHRAVPGSLHPKVAAVLRGEFSVGLYSHQADAIERALAGDDVCVSTSTASGKSLVFLSVAASLVLGDPTRRVLALYPARALIQDQLGKWRTFAERLGLGVGTVDGGVMVERRIGLLEENPVVLMTPDVVQAWLLARLDEAKIRRFVERLQLIVLDEAHVYDGVFGTNMCFLMRRLLAVAPQARLVVSTATIDRPGAFVETLTGRAVTVFERDADGAGSPDKVVLWARGPSKRDFDRIAKLLGALAREPGGRFLAFADSRKAVEKMVAVVARMAGRDEDADTSDREEGPRSPAARAPLGVLPYRAGYETEDREEIQRALARGELKGVVSTSALELGLDIGEINLVVLLNAPTSMKAFWQRMGRAGRRSAGTCLIVDGEGKIREAAGGLQGYLDRPLEPNWLYLENRYIQYVNALCAAHEARSVPARGGTHEVFATLPEAFGRMVRNELDPSEAVPADLYPLKQRGQAEPHREFPLRSCMEQAFQVEGPMGARLGNLTLSQVLREAYPGAVYYYMGRPYRVKQFELRKGLIRVGREKFVTTEPRAQAKVFPRFDGAFLGGWRSASGFVLETEAQVSERVLGFVEKRGAAREVHLYGPGSPYFQRELNRFFETTGVCWCLPGGRGASEAVAGAVKRAFCLTYGVQERELGVGSFFSKRAPSGEGPCQGACIFDATSGSLRLTQRLGENFGEVLSRAAELCSEEHDEPLARELAILAEHVAQMRAHAGGGALTDAGPTDQDWVVLVAPGDSAMLLGPAGSEEVTVTGFRYTPQGLLYDLAPRMPNVRWAVRHETIQPIHGVTRLLRYNLMSGDEEEL